MSFVLPLPMGWGAIGGDEEQEMDEGRLRGVLGEALVWLLAETMDT